MATRSSQLPDVPTAAEAGLPGYISESWFGVAVPAGTPKDVVAKLEQSMFKAGRDAARKARLAEAGIEMRLLSGNEFAQYIRAEERRLVPLIQKLDLKV